MKSTWTYGVPTERHAEIKQKVKANKEAWLLLSETLSRKIKSYEPDYSDHSWAFRQAHQNGYNQALREVIALLDLTKGD